VLFDLLKCEGNWQRGARQARVHTIGYVCVADKFYARGLPVSREGKKEARLKAAVFDTGKPIAQYKGLSILNPTNYSFTFTARDGFDQAVLPTVLTSRHTPRGNWLSSCTAGLIFNLFSVVQLLFVQITSKSTISPATQRHPPLLF
jgi:hypothetical protein